MGVAAVPAHGPPPRGDEGARDPGRAQAAARRAAAGHAAGQALVPAPPGPGLLLPRQRTDRLHTDEGSGFVEEVSKCYAAAY